MMYTHIPAIGIDVAKDTFVAADTHDRTRTFPNTKAGVRECLSWAIPPKDTVIGMEATGVYHLSLCLTLQSYGVQPVIINPLTAKRYAGLSLRKTKTDKTDARVIRKALIAGEGYPFVDTAETIALRALMTERRGLVSLKQALSGGMHAHTVRAQAAHIPFVDTLSPVRRVVDTQLREIDKQCARYAPDTQKLLRSIPGIGTVASATLVSIVGDISRFASRDQFVAFVGIDPAVSESGTSVKQSGSITKRGNKMLRHVLHQAAFVATRHDPEFARFYRKKQREGKHHFVIVTALERKLCARIFAVWTRGTPFVKAE